MFGEKILIIFTWVSRFNLSSLLAYMHTLDFAMHGFNYLLAARDR